MYDEPKSSVGDGDDFDNVSIVSEISTCSSAVTVTLEPVDEEPKSLAKRKPPPSPTPTSKSTEPSSSEAEEEESKKSGRTSKKISNFFSFNSSPGNSSSSHQTSVGENQSDRSVVAIDRKKSRRPSITRKISPLALGIFSAGTLQNATDCKPEIASEKDPKKPSVQSKIMSRRLSFTKFQKQSSNDKLDTGKKRRNTDPNLLQKQKSPGTIVESESENQKPVDGDAADTGSLERTRKVSFNALAPSVQEPRENHTRVEPEEGNFKDEDIKLRNLIGNVLRYLQRFDAELQTIEQLNNAVKGRQGRIHASREDNMKTIIKVETELFNTGGLEVPDLTSSKNFKLFKEWNCDMKCFSPINMKSFTNSPQSTSQPTDESIADKTSTDKDLIGDNDMGSSS
ncbi:hypothetical protein QZH41_002533 [Actinostola sp. cb2023]|nr:hypothetical protein QZH41_002533 [Actinostola sp. cb2023]